MLRDAGDNSGVGDAQLLCNISAKLTEETLLEVLQGFADRQDVRVSSYEVRPVVADGGNYQASVSRITLAGTSTTGSDRYAMSVIVKGLTHNPCHMKTFHTLEFFANETVFYEKVWPKLLAFQEKVKPEHRFTGIPRCYKALADGENDFIILEDLCPAGYRMVPRKFELDYAHCSKILTVLAGFHALSLAVRDQQPDTFHEAADSLQELYYKAELKYWYNNVLQEFLGAAKGAMSKEMPGSVYEEKLQRLAQGDLYSRVAQLVADSKEPHGVVSHGDLWITNLMCRFTEGDLEPLDVKLLDFQLAHCTSPALDISMFIYSCTLQDLRERHYDTLIAEYHATLSRFLERLGSSPDKVYPLATLHKELATYAVFGVCMALEVVNLSLVDKTAGLNLQGNDAVPLETVLKPLPLDCQDHRLRICHIIKHAVDCGYL